MEMSQEISPPATWDIQAARALYNIHRWGAKYFDINEAGHVVAMPLRENGAVVDLTDVIEEAKGRGLKSPVLIRFQDILRDRVEAINQAFAASIAEFNYQNTYRGVFPIKVNQLREVVEEILDAGKPYHFGLEVGSKPELFASLALQSQPGCLIICNGYKDALFIRMALMGIKLGKRVIMVVEKLEELPHIIAISQQMGVEPILGIRVRLLSKGSGKWADSGGENAKFGLNTAELVAACEMLRAEKMESCFKLLHFHIGSQVPDILTIKKAVSPLSRWTWAAVWGWITTAAARPLTVRPITRCRSTPTTLSFTSARSATRSRCRIRKSSAKAGGPLSLITACCWWRRWAPSAKSGPGRPGNTATTSTPWFANCSTSRRSLLTTAIF